MQGLAGLACLSDSRRRQGAEPGPGRLQVVKGIVEGCRQSDCVLLGGEVSLMLLAAGSPHTPLVLFATCCGPLRAVLAVHVS